MNRRYSEASAEKAEQKSLIPTLLRSTPSFKQHQKTPEPKIRGALKCIEGLWAEQK